MNTTASSPRRFHAIPEPLIDPGLTAQTVAASVDAIGADVEIGDSPPFPAPPAGQVTA